MDDKELEGLEEVEGVQLKIRTESILLPIAAMTLIVVGGIISCILGIVCGGYGIYLLWEDIMLVKEDYVIDLDNKKVYKRPSRHR